MSPRHQATTSARSGAPGRDRGNPPHRAGQAAGSPVPAVVGQAGRALIPDAGGRGRDAARLVAERISRDLPGVKLLVLLRDPVERAYSGHAHEISLGFETEPFERALELEPGRLEGEVERILAGPAYISRSHQHHAYHARGGPPWRSTTGRMTSAWPGGSVTSRAGDNDGVLADKRGIKVRYWVPAS